MDSKNLSDLFPPVLSIAGEAGGKILEVYGRHFEVDYKEDRSPLTLADRLSHGVIAVGLARLSPRFPVLSEEGRDIPYDERKGWEYFWLVDPLDGTKEFIKKNGEFTVNIALIRGGKPVIGVIYVPVKDICYFAGEGLGAYKLPNASEALGVRSEESGVRCKGSDVRGEAIKSVIFFRSVMETAKKLPLPKKAERPFTVAASRSHMSEETEAYLDRLKAEHGRIDLISAGSSLKFCLVAEGKADVYPRLGPTMEWDTAAGQCIAEESGAETVAIADGLPIRYNREDLRNGPFVCRKRAGSICLGTGNRTQWSRLKD
jgi:3'(2'), 5'-bisphosphate nucleotidase